MRKKGLLCVALCASLLAATLGGCGSKDAGNSQASTESATENSASTGDSAAGSTKDKDSGKSVTLTLLANQDWVTKPYMKKIWEMYEQETGNKLDIQAVPIDSGDSIMKTKFATGEIPDIFMNFGGYSLKAYQPEKNFVDFSDAEWITDVQDYVLPQATYEGKVYGIPFWEAAISGVLYNKEIFEKLNIEVPTNQQEFMAACETIKQAGITPVYMPTKDQWPLLYQFGLDIIASDEDTLEKLNSNQITYADIPEFKSMIEWYKEMTDKGYFGDTFATDSWDGAPTALGEEKAAMMFAWDSYVDTDIAPKYPDDTDKFGIMPAFMGVNEEGSFEGPNVCLTFANKNGEHVEEAIEFIEFMANPENYNQAFDGYGTSPVFKGQTTNITTPLYDEAKAVIDEKTIASTARPNIIGFTQVEGAAYIQDMMIGNITVDQCIEAMDNDRIQIAQAQQVEGF